MQLARIIVSRCSAAFSTGIAQNTTNSRVLVEQFRTYTARKSLPESLSTITKAKVKDLETRVSPSLAYRLVHQYVPKVPPTSGLAKRTQRKKRTEFDELSAQGFFNVTAFATAEEYNLEALLEGLNEQKLYGIKKFFSTDNLGVEQDVLYVTAMYSVGPEERDIFFFREGSVVMWNFNEIEANNILSFLRPFEKEPYLKPIVKGESEVMPYTYVSQPKVDVEGDLIAEAQLGSPRAFFHKGKFYLSDGEDSFLQKYTFSNAMTTSIKLGVWEATLDRYIDSMEYLTDDLRKGRRIRMTRGEVLRKTGELFSLRHAINLSSDLLDTPDFYWDREELETLYMQVCSYFAISRRTKVMNEKINHCIELAELISHNLNDAHHIRLEWMIIILIMVEVGFEILHYLDRFYGKEEASHLNPRVVPLNEQ